MYMTTNLTTTTVGQATATVLARTQHPGNPTEIITWELLYPRYIHCYDEETEILAVVGNDGPKFMSFAKAKALGAQVAQYDKVSGRISFVEPEVWHEQKGTHRMVKFEGSKLSLAVTDGHRMLVDKRTTGNAFVPEVWTAEQFLGDYICCHLRQSGVCEEGQKYSKEELALMAWYACDGTKQGKRICFHFRKQRKIDAVCGLLDSLGIPFVRNDYEDSTCIWCEAPAWVDDCYTDSGEKKLPEEGMFMDQQSYEAVKKALLESDGCVANMEFNSTSKALAEQVQVLAHLHGDAMNLRSYGKGKYKRTFKSCFKGDSYVALCRDKDVFTEEVKECTVYCVTVPSSFVVVRRHGVVLISGNCEFMTHRMFSRNACSSRATPVKTLIEQVRTNPVYFDEVRQNQRGMTGGELVDAVTERKFHDLWMQGAQVAATLAEQMAELGVAKQTANRILEPFLPIRVIVTATDTDNFFSLRLAPDAQPEIRNLAKAMKESMEKVFTGRNVLHLPYAEYFDDEPHLARTVIRCIAACARVSVARGNGKETTYEDDLALVRRLRQSGHMTPFEHVAIAASDWTNYANLRNWMSIRTYIEMDCPITEIPDLSDILEGHDD